MARGEKGFTLIELLIVVAIIAILATVAAPKLLDALDRGRRTSTMANIRKISDAIEIYQIDKGHYPIVTSIQDLRTVLEPRYLMKLPTNDGWKNSFLYLPSALAGRGYTIRSVGKDGQAQAALAGQGLQGGLLGMFDGDIVLINGSFVQEQQ